MRAWLLTPILVAGCLDDRGEPALDGLVVDPGTTQVVLAWLPATTRETTPGRSVEVDVDGDRHFDPEQLLPAPDDPIPTGDCGDGMIVNSLAGLPNRVCPGERAVDHDLQLGLARIVGFAGDPVPTDVGATLPPSRSVSDDIEVVWASQPITRESQAWPAFQAELPAGATLVRRVRCPEAVNVCNACWPFAHAAHCVEPIGQRDQVLLRPWLDADGNPRE